MHHSYIDEYSGIDSFIHRLDPRIKVLSFVIFLLFIIFTPLGGIFSLSLYAGIILVLIFISRIPLSYFFKKTLVVIPFMLLLSISIPFMRQSKNAWEVLIYILIKSYLSILCMVLFLASTKFNALLKAMEKLRCPKLILLTLSFMYRYIFVVEDEMMKMQQAKEARSVGGSSWFHFRALSNMVGVLFIRAYDRAEYIYLAMRARGFDGQIQTLNDLKLTGKDLIFFIFILLSLASIRIIAK